MSTFHQRLCLDSIVKQRASQVWQSAMLESERWLRWLKLRPQAAFFAAGVVGVLLLLVYGGVTAAVAAVAAWIALMRHFAQTEADRQRRIAESFSKAVEQLGSDKLEVRLGGIYSLERISKESQDEYWTVMENLTAFIRERSRRDEAERMRDFEHRVSQKAYSLWQEAGLPDGQADGFWADAVDQDRLGQPPATDVATALTVINRRSESGRERESANDWSLDLSRAALGCAYLPDARLEAAILANVNFKGAILRDAHFQGAMLAGADLSGMILENADFTGATLQATYLRGAYLEGANFAGANLQDAKLECTDLSRAVGLSEAQIAEALGDAMTILPAGLGRPAHWAAQDPDAMSDYWRPRC
jgi:hypothetical protein